MAIQRGIRTALWRADGHAMQLRIGLHLGDVIVRFDGDASGDSVNIASRLQAQAEPGGIIVSDSVHCAVGGRVAAIFVDRGEIALKNIPHPVRSFSMREDPAAPGLDRQQRYHGPALVPPTALRTTPADGAGAGSAAGAIMKILFVDDHALFREGLVELLKGLAPQVEVVQAGNAATALTLAAAKCYAV